MKVSKKLQKELDLGLTVEVPGGMKYYRVTGGQWYRDSNHTPGEVIKISLHEVPDNVVTDCLGLDKKDGVRYKTRQELDAIIKPGIIDDLPWGEPHEEGSGHSKLFLTTDPHPYEGKSFIIKIQTAEESNMVQKKAFALRYEWEKGYKDFGETHVRVDLGTNDLLIDKDYLWYNPSKEDYKEFECLPPQQFMEGEVPLTAAEWERKRHDEQLIFQKPITEAEATKPDAFVIEAKDGYMYLWTEANKRLREAPGSLYRYNLMHCNEYFAKHPDTLKFKEWEVTSGDGTTTVGCKTFFNSELKAFSKVTQTLNTHQVDAKEFYTFLYCNKEKLGLDF